MACACRCSASVGPSSALQQRPTVAAPRSLPAASSSAFVTAAACAGLSSASPRLPLRSGRAARLASSIVASAAPTATASVSAAGFAGPLASLTRILSQQPQNIAKTLTKGGARVAGPISLLLFLITLLGAAMAFIRHLLVRKVKSCATCRGYGITRCRLCGGAGRVDWHAKNKHATCCPLCMNKRFVTCAECGGYFHRSLFSHHHRDQKAELVVVHATPAGTRGVMAKEMVTSAND